MPSSSTLHSRGYRSLVLADVVGVPMKIELVVWHDIASDDGTWRALEDIEDEDTPVQSVGWVAKETDKYVTLAMDLEAGINTANRSRIPKAVIVSRVVLKESENV